MALTQLQRAFFAAGMALVFEAQKQNVFEEMDKTYRDFIKAAQDDPMVKFQAYFEHWLALDTKEFQNESTPVIVGTMCKCLHCHAFASNPTGSRKDS